MAGDSRESRHPRKRPQEENFEKQGEIKSNAAEVVGKDVSFGFCTVEAVCGSSKSRFGLVAGKYRLRMADEQVQADCRRRTQEAWL